MKTFIIVATFFLSSFASAGTLKISQKADQDWFKDAYYGSEITVIGEKANPSANSSRLVCYGATSFNEGQDRNAKDANYVWSNERSEAYSFKSIDDCMKTLYVIQHNRSIQVLIITNAEKTVSDVLFGDRSVL